MKSSTVRKTIVSIILILALVVGGFVVIGIGAAIRKEPEQSEALVPAIAVETMKLSRERVTEKLYGFGLASPLVRAEISAQIAGTVREIPNGIRVGGIVKKGDVLAKIDDARYAADVARAEALVAEAKEALAQNAAEREQNVRKLELIRRDLEIAKSDLTRAEDLLESGALSESQRDQASSAVTAVEQRVSDIVREGAILSAGETRAGATVRARESDLIVARENLAYTSPRAPFDGIIDMRAVDAGDYVSPGKTLFAIVDDSRLELPIQVPASQSRALKEGAPARLSTDESPPRVATGTVERVSPTIDPATRTKSAYVIFDAMAGGEALAAGAFMSAAVDGRIFDDVFAIPRSAIVDDRIYLAGKDGIAHVIAPDFFVMLEDMALTRDDLGEEPRLILGGFEQLYDGAPVKVPSLPSENPATPEVIGAAANAQ